MKGVLKLTLMGLALCIGISSAKADELKQLYAFGYLVDTKGQPVTGQFLLYHSGLEGRVMSNELSPASVRGTTVMAQFTAFEGATKDGTFSPVNSRAELNVNLRMLRNENPAFLAYRGGRVLTDYKGHVIAQNVIEKGVPVCKISYIATTLDGKALPALSAEGSLYSTKRVFVNGQLQTITSPTPCFMR